MDIINAQIGARKGHFYFPFTFNKHGVDLS